ncbi:transposase [Rathayibacter sp. YIM 133350]|uniref:transposase n=1 Tax=Rathayibacter sp. YIM 133350 TaxID=3131992 RepID=UPI00307D10BA
MGTDALTQAAEELYGLPLAEFTRARNDRARELRASDRALSESIGGLRKPAADAWVVNQLVRESRSDVEDLLDLGARLRAAQDALDAGELASLSRERRRAVAQLVDQAAALAGDAGQKLGPAVRDAVGNTLNAAVADAWAAQAVLTGRLVRGLESVGFDPVDLRDATAGGVGTATPRTAVDGGEAHARKPAARKSDSRKPGGRESSSPTSDAGTGAAGERARRAQEREQELRERTERAERARAEERRQAQKEADEARRQFEGAREESDRLQHQLDDAHRAEAALRERQRDLEEQLRRVDRELSSAEHEVRTLDRDHDRAVRRTQRLEAAAVDADDAVRRLS